MAKHDPWAAAKPRLTAAVEGLHRKDEALRDAKDRERGGGESSTLPLASIQPRPHGDARPLDAEHVIVVAESIITVGLLQPIAVDRKNRLVCGGHRLAAIQHLAANAPDAFAHRFPNGEIPVRILSDLDAHADPSSARAAELEENEKRKGFTKDQVLALAEQLRQGGYHFTVGRPKAGEAALAPTLAVATGHSLRTIRRYLANDAAPATRSEIDALERAEHSLQRAAAAFRAVAQGSRRERVRRILHALDQVDLSLNEE
ncbi:MAG: ParB N-terminal domain-containing protein [Planctomycetes bacterium]|nr:ParB N-terminal domain-containing protein [Planctomycetota bacterium]